MIPFALARGLRERDVDLAVVADRLRRRGTELENAILDAAWEQLTAEGYEHFTIDTVAARAQTSKPVLYRRWKTREDLLRATVRQPPKPVFIPLVTPALPRR